jgi:hypothetical protein
MPSERDNFDSRVKECCRKLNLWIPAVCGRSGSTCARVDVPKQLRRKILPFNQFKQ